MDLHSSASLYKDLTVISTIIKHTSVCYTHYHKIQQKTNMWLLHRQPAPFKPNMWCPPTFSFP